MKDSSVPYSGIAALAPQNVRGARHFKDYHELLARDVDAVYIATPPFLHPECFEAAVVARKHIFI